MSWEEIWNQPQRWDEFAFYAKGSTPMSETTGFLTAFRMNPVRLHFSTSFVSVEDFVIKLKSVKGSQYDQLVISKSMSGITDYILIMDSSPLGFVSGDQLLFSMSTAAGANTWGVICTGWSVRG